MAAWCSFMPRDSACESLGSSPQNIIKPLGGRALRFLLNCKRNCHNCIHLGWEGGELPDGRYEEGFVCHKRIYADRIENCEASHLERLEDEKYRLRGKRCCEVNLIAQSCSILVTLLRPLRPPTTQPQTVFFTKKVYFECIPKVPFLWPWI